MKLFSGVVVLCLLVLMLPIVASATISGTINMVTVYPNHTVTMFTNTGDEQYYGVTNKIEVIDASGKVTTTVSDPIVTAFVPGAQVNFTLPAVVNPGDTVISTMFNGDNIFSGHTLQVPSSFSADSPARQPTTKSPLGLEIGVISVLGAIAFFHKQH